MLTLIFGFSVGFLLHPILPPLPNVSEYSGYNKMADLLNVKHSPAEPRILCWVLTSPANHKRRATHVHETCARGRRCDRLLFMTTRADPQLDGAVVLNLTAEGRDQLWSKTKAAFTYVYKHHLEEADWFLKADDDTYIVVENLRRMLAEFNSRQLIHFGHRFKALGGYFSGGAGYVLSQAAVKRLVQDGLEGQELCSHPVDGEKGNEDVNMGACMRACNITV